MPTTIVSDTSCLILLDKIGELPLLQKLFGQIITTQIVADEFGSELPAWISVQNPTDRMRQRKIASRLGLSITRTLGVLAQAKQRGHIPLVKPLLNRIKETNFRLSERLIEETLRQAGE